VTDPEAVVRQLWESINTRDYPRLAGAIAETCEWTSVASGATYRGPVAMVNGLRRFVEGFPDLRGEILNLIAVGETVVVEWRVTGTNVGPLDEREPTLRKLNRRGCSVAEVRGGKIVSYRDYFDRLTLAEQLGL
jgi:ketosteroid isomerase-like protein